jgi:hypothetical protein
MDPISSKVLIGVLGLATTPLRDSVRERVQLAYKKALGLHGHDLQRATAVAFERAIEQLVDDPSRPWDIALLRRLKHAAPELFPVPSLTTEPDPVFE